MASNSFGNIFRITTWGESHGKAIGVVIDGCPAGIDLNLEEINLGLSLRAPGKNQYTTPRLESDLAEIYSGVFEGKTTGAPISIIIMNHDVDSSKYDAIRNILRPGHANFTYLNKYGENYDYRGGGRASARETACRVAAGVVAKKILLQYGIQTTAYLRAMSDVQLFDLVQDINQIQMATLTSPVYCPDVATSEIMISKINAAKLAGDSLGGVVEFLATGLPIGFGDPIYEKLEANLAKAMLSLPASKGFEIGDGFVASQLSGLEHNDLFIQENHQIKTKTNHAGGILGGISTGMPITGRVAFKPTSSINQSQLTVDNKGASTSLQLPLGSRHDPCVAIRAVPVVDAMCALVLVDALLMNRCAKINL